jgi:AraC family transcriptional regulator
MVGGVMHAVVEPILSSRGRGWRGVSAALVAMPARLVEAGPLTRHVVSVHVGAPVRVACRLDGGPLRRRLQTHGDVDVLPAGAAGRWHDETPATALVIHVSHALVREAAGRMGLDADGAALVAEQQVRDARLTHVGWALLEELRAESAGDAAYVDGLAAALAAQLLRRSRAVPPLAGVGLAPRRRQRVLDYIDTHLDGDLSLAALGRVAGLGASQLTASFRRSFGVSIRQYVIQRRVEHAKALLLHGDLPLAAVALEAGFAHQSHLARSMRRVLGVTPREVRAARA